tara:strand:+ start:725 stop:1765 length:1041 start_codon:yes stop_codon:yes gene_type:complete
MSFDLTNKNISETFQNLLQKTGSDGHLYDLLGNKVRDLRIDGTLSANSYITSQSIVQVSSGSNIFGDSLDDTQKMTGSLDITGSITASGYISASDGFYVGDKTNYVSSSLGNVLVKGTGAAKLTVAGNITASGNIFLDKGEGVNGTKIYMASPLTNQGFMNYDVGLKEFFVNADNTRFSNHITASGDISASGNIIGTLSSAKDVATVDYGDGTAILAAAGDYSGELIKSGDDSTTPGNLYYLKSDGVWTSARADVGQTGNEMSSSLLGVAVGTNSTTHGMLVRGIVYVNGITDTEVVGQRVFVGEAAGTFTTTAPTTTGDIVRVVGYTLATSKIYFNPDPTWIKLS